MAVDIWNLFAEAGPLQGATGAYGLDGLAGAGVSAPGTVAVGAGDARRESASPDATANPLPD